MGEYDRRQQKQQSRAIANSGGGSSQLKGFVDNRPQTVGQSSLIDSIQQKPNNTGLPDSLKSGIENLSGYSLDDVKVHYNSDKPAQLSALAYAQGTDIHVASGQEKHLPHEAWHVVQQKQGRVRPTVQLQGVNVNDNEGLKKEADMMRERSIENIFQLKRNDGTVQCAPWDNCNVSFQTDNKLESIPNSIYQVTNKSYKRYAPINAIRAPSQEYHEDQRTFAYVPKARFTKDLWNATKVELVYNGIDIRIFIKNGYVDAKYKPENEYMVWDAKTNDTTGKVESGIHIGHAVKNIGCSAGPLIDNDELKRLKMRKKAIIDAQTKREIPQDKEILTEMGRFIKESLSDGSVITYDKGMELWESSSIVGKKVKDIQDKADKRAEIERRLQNIRSSSLYGFSDRMGEIEKKLMDSLKELD